MKSNLLKILLTAIIIAVSMPQEAMAQRRVTQSPANKQEEPKLSPEDEVVRQKMLKAVNYKTTIPHLHDVNWNSIYINLRKKLDVNSDFGRMYNTFQKLGFDIGAPGQFSWLIANKKDARKWYFRLLEAAGCTLPTWEEFNAFHEERFKHLTHSYMRERVLKAIGSQTTIPHLNDVDWDAHRRMGIDVDMDVFADLEEKEDLEVLEYLLMINMIRSYGINLGTSSYQFVYLLTTSVDARKWFFEILKTIDPHVTWEKFSTGMNGVSLRSK